MLKPKYFPTYYSYLNVSGLQCSSAPELILDSSTAVPPFLSAHANRPSAPKYHHINTSGQHSESKVLECFIFVIEGHIQELVFAVL